MTLFRHFALCSVAIALAAAGPAFGQSLQDIGKLMKQGQNTQALEQVDQYLAGKPKDAQGRFLKGLILTELNRTNDAVAVFQKLTEDYPELPEPYNNLAVIYAQQKQYEKAKQALEMAIRTHPSYATAHENLGDIYARMASQAYDKALQIDSSNTSAQTKLSMIRDLMSVNARPAQVAAATKPVVVAAAPAPARPVEAKPADTKPAEPPKPAEAKPATAPVKAGGDPAADAAKSIEAWAAAWSHKDAKTYLAHYAADFKTPDGMPRAKWEAERTMRVTKPGEISVSVEELRVSSEGADKATAHFRQRYKSANLKGSGYKTLELVRRDGQWLIVQERMSN